LRGGGALALALAGTGGAGIEGLTLELAASGIACGKPAPAAGIAMFVGDAATDASAPLTGGIAGGIAGIAAAPAAATALAAIGCGSEEKSWQHAGRSVRQGESLSQGKVAPSKPVCTHDSL